MILTISIYYPVMLIDIVEIKILEMNLPERYLLVLI